MNKKQVKCGPKIRQGRPSLNRIKIKGDTTLTIEDRHLIYTCQYCHVKFTQNSQYFRHMSDNHHAQRKLATYQCNDCKIVFTKKANLDLHYQTNHQLKSKSKCDSCSVIFKSRYCLRRHMKLKQILSENSCMKCQKKYVNKEELAKHVKNKHTFPYAIFSCDYCSLKFKMKASLASHVTRIHLL